MATATNSKLTDAIKTANKNLAGLLAKGDAAGVAACYTKDAILMAPKSKPCKGHKAIAAWWQGGMEMGIKSVSLRTTEVEAHGTTAIECGVATIKGAGNKTLDTASYVVIWKRDGKTWKLHRDIFNSNKAA